MEHTIEEKYDNENKLPNLQSLSNENSVIENITLQSAKQYDMYLKGLESSVEQYKKMFPEKYEKAQSIGDDMMNKKYELKPGEDIKGDLIKCKTILLTILQYGLEINDLYDNEIRLIKKIFTDVFNIVNDINDIITNVENIENIIRMIINKLSEYDNYY